MARSFVVFDLEVSDHAEQRVRVALKVVVTVREVDGKRHDAGDKLGFLMATVELALKREDLGGEFREYLKTLDLNT